MAGSWHAKLKVKETNKSVAFMGLQVDMTAYVLVIKLQVVYFQQKFSKPEHLFLSLTVNRLSDILVYFVELQKGIAL